MIGLPGDAWRLCQLAVEKGYLNEQQVDEVFARGEEFSSAEMAGDWLVEAGLLTDQEWQDLRATWTTVHGGEASADGHADGDTQKPAHLHSTVYVPRVSGEARLPKIPGYRIVEKVGQGGMGVVYKARQDSPSRWVALKAMLGGAYAAEHARQRFAREIEATASLSHPGVVPVYEAGEHEGFLYYTMEYVEGQPLHDYLQQHPLGLRERLGLFRQVCAAVAHAHAHGLVHRDLKPGNILIERDGRPRVLDFGLAKLLLTPDSELADSLVTRAGTVVGTYAYMSPEQARGMTDQVDERSDVYSLGVILYEMLTGRLPHTGESLDGLVRAICQDEPRRPSAVDRSLRGDLDTIVLTCLEKLRERRYQSVAEISADIGRYLRIEPIRARPASRVTHARKFVRRNRVKFVAGLLAVGLAAVTGLALHFVPIYALLGRLDSPEARLRATAWKEVRTLAPGLGLRKAVGILKSTPTPERALEAIDYMAASEVAERREQIRPALEGALGAPWPEVRARALAGLVQFDHEAVLQWGLRTLASGTQQQRAEALAGLRSVDWGPHQQEAVKALKAVLDAPDADLRALAWEVLAAQAPEAARSSIVSVLQLQGAADRKLQALESLRMMSPFARHLELERTLVHVLGAADENRRPREDGIVREEAAKALVWLGAHVDWPALKELLLREGEPPVGEQLARLTRACPDADVTDALCQALETILAFPLPVLWKPMILELLAHMGARREPAERVRNVLHETLGVNDDEIQLAALDAIGKMPIAPADADKWAAPLSGFLSEGKQAIRDRAVRVACRLAAPCTAADVARAIDRATSGPELVGISELAQEMHMRLTDSHPAAAAEVRRALLDLLRRGMALLPSHYGFVVAEPWRSSEDLSAFIGAPPGPRCLDHIALHLKSESAAIRDGAARCLRLLTGDRIGRAGMTFDETKAEIARGWRWDANGHTFVPRDRS